MTLLGRTFVCAALLSSAVSVVAQSPPSYPNEPYIIEQARTQIRYDADGTGRREEYVRIKTQSDAGVQQWGQLVLGYSAATEALEIPLVRVRKADGTVVDTPPTAVQDLSSPVQRVAPVYTDFREKHITVESLRPGDTLEFRVVTTLHTALAPGEFWMEQGFNDDAIVLDEQLDVDVPAGKHVSLKLRPGFDPTITDANGRRVYHWAHSHTVREDPDELKKKEKEKNPDDPEYAPIRLTTFENWEAVGRWFDGLEETARAVTPEIRQKAQELTKGKTTDLAKLQALYDFVSKDFRYVSLSLGAGRYQPRPAASVLHDAYGDCKDKATLLASFIDAAGLHASDVLINSRVALDPEFPSPSQFDHVITRAVVDGKPVWLDATPEVAPFGLLLFQLHDKQALVAEPGAASHLERTPVDSPVPFLLRVKVAGKVDDQGTMAGDVTVTSRGDMEVLMRTAFRGAAEPQWKTMVEQMPKQWNDAAKVSDVHVSDPQDTTDPFTINFHLEVPTYVNWQSQQVALSLPMGERVGALSDPPEKGKIRLGPPGEIEYALQLEMPAGADLHAPVAVAVKRDYGEYRATYSAAEHTFAVDRLMVLRQRELPDDRHDDYAAFVRVVNGDQKQQLSADASHVLTSAATSSNSSEAATLNRRGYDALMAGHYDDAAALLKRTVELEPKDKTAWANLGRAYASLDRMDEAIAAYKKQIEVNPYDDVAYVDLGLAYVQRRQYSDAEAAYLKELEIDPLNRFAQADLGQMYNEQHLYQKAAAALEKAVAVAPKVPAYDIQLGKAYLALGERDKASAAFDKAVELSPSPRSWNDIAYELALAGVDLDRAQRYAESAVTTAVAMSRNVDVDHAAAGALGVVSQLASYWDTLGWVAFAKADYARAEKYVAAAWIISESPEVGDHLGQIYEKQGRHADAIAAFARAVNGVRPDPSVHEHLAAAVGGGKADATIAAHKEDLRKARVVAVDGRGPAGKTADFFIVFASSGAADGVRFISGDETMKPFQTALEKLRVTGMFPDDQPARLLRRAAVACGSDGRCEATLVLPSDARPEK